ncbi:hypothetical protein [Peribacillus sp. SI8-4]|uniref:hypothetical protein n=1 Tax=Peribacillus sp. SI8-4 TaxID=3048009 RepID=UPI003325855E
MKISLFLFMGFLVYLLLTELYNSHFPTSGLSSAVIFFISVAVIYFLKSLQNFALKGKCEHPSLKVEADFSADPIWCNVCGFNLDMDDFPLSEELKEELFNWVQNYKEIPIDEHNKMGTDLTAKVKEELGRDYPIIFFKQ